MKTRNTRIITEQDFFNFIRKPVVLFIAGVLACLFAFGCGVRYARSSTKINSIVYDLAFVEIAGWEGVYDLPAGYLSSL